MKLFNKRTLRKGELRNVEVELVSLLFDEMNPANQKGFVVKSATGKAFTHITPSTKFKAETVGSQGRLYVTLMEPGVRDAQGDSYSHEEIVKACDHFAKNGLVGKNDVNHNMTPVPEFAVVENYILKTEDKAHFPDSKVGSWVQVIKCDDLSSPLWQKVIKGAFHGVSIYGKAEDAGVPDNSAAIAELKGLLAELKKTATAAPAANPANPADPNPAIAAIESRLADLSKADADADSAQLIKSLTSELKELSVAITKAISKSLKGEPDSPSAADSEITIDGQKVLVKSSHAEIYKGIAQVDAGAPMNILTANTTSLFIDEVVGAVEDDTLSDITVVPLIKDEKIDAGLISDLVLTNSLDTAAAAQAITSSEITCATGILTGAFSLDRSIVEFYKDKYGEAAFGAYVEQHIAKKTSKAIKKLLFQGNRDAAPGVLKALDGVIQLALEASGGSKVVAIDTDSYPLFADRFEQALLSFSDDVLAEMESFVFYISNKDLVRLRAELAQRETGAGDRFLLEGGNVSFAGIPVKPRYMADNYIVAGLPKFIIIGYRTEAELKVEHHGSDWKYYWYIRVRPGITYVDGFVKVFLAASGS